jgi:SAM-dependent methyltransferase
VYGLDVNIDALSLARRVLTPRGLSHVRLVHADARATQMPENSFDLVHERLLLMNLASPQDVVKEMVRIVRPGGWVLLENADWITWTCEPPHPAWEQLCTALGASCRAAGLDMYIGRRLPGLLQAAGLIDTGVAAHSYIWRTGDVLHDLLPTFVRIQRQRILDQEVFSPEDLDHLLGELEEHLVKPETFVVHPLFFQAWGRKPGIGERQPVELP